MAKIESLSAEQIARFPHYVSEWTAHGLRAAPADRSESELAIREMYSVAGLPPPEVIWAQSPLSGALVVTVLRRASVGASVGDSVGASVGASVRTSIRTSVAASVRDSVGASVGASVWDSVGASVRDSVGASVGASVRASVGDSVWASVGDSVRDSVGASVGDSVWGQHEAPWLSFYAFFAEECGLKKETEKLSGLWRLCKSCGWIYPYGNLCVATERPVKCSVDDTGFIHCEDGPAIQYKDGFAVYGWHGTRLPGDWVENRKTIDPAEILKCPDVEQRAAGAAMVGWPRMLAHLKHEVIDRGPDSDWGDLLRVWMPGLNEPALMLKAECPRNGTIMEFVPEQGRSLDGRTYPVNSVVAAQAARVFKHPETYRHPQRRT